MAKPSDYVVHGEIPVGDNLLPAENVGGFVDEAHIEDGLLRQLNLQYSPHRKRHFVVTSTRNMVAYVVGEAKAHGRTKPDTRTVDAKAKKFGTTVTNSEELISDLVAEGADIMPDISRGAAAAIGDQQEVQVLAMRNGVKVASTFGVGFADTDEAPIVVDPSSPQSVFLALSEAEERITENGGTMTSTVFTYTLRRVLRERIKPDGTRLEDDPFLGADVAYSKNLAKVSATLAPGEQAVIGFAYDRKAVEGWQLLAIEASQSDVAILFDYDSNGKVVEESNAFQDDLVHTKWRSRLALAVLFPELIIPIVIEGAAVTP